MNFSRLNNRKASIISVLIVCLILSNYVGSWEFMAVSSVILLLGFVWSPFGALIEKFWMSITKPISFIMPKILLSLIFYLILTPIALLNRILTKEDVFKKENSRHSLWEDEKESYPTDSFRKMW